MQPEPGIKQRFEERFLEFVRNEKLWNEGDKILIAVSGGVDSVVLARLIATYTSDCAIAHCNFNLRGEESKRDEEFTTRLAAELGLPLFVEQFNTHEVAFREGISVEMAARDLRYAWFGGLMKMHHYQLVAAGHHADDQIETFLLNLARGTGISGLRGMLPLTSHIIRPLLPFFRSEIVQYAKECGYPWIEDSSNLSTEFRRNQIRHQMIPQFLEINPGFRETMTRTMSNIRDAEMIYQKQIAENLAAITSVDGEITRVHIPGLKMLSPCRVFLFELLAPYGFNAATAETIERSLDGISGKQFSSPTHRVVKDRDHLLIIKGTSTPGEEEWQYLIHEDDAETDEPLSLTFEVHPAEGFSLPGAPSVAALDLHRLRFPLMIRRWQHGDHFYPLGMSNRKKLSDFFSDQKWSVFDKENAWVLVSGEDIVWLAGHRIDHRYRITNTTQSVYLITMKG
jgi:tRNA(Ile)-lysidine synthase